MHAQYTHQNLNPQLKQHKRDWHGHPREEWITLSTNVSQTIGINQFQKQYRRKNGFYFLSPSLLDGSGGGEIGSNTNNARLTLTFKTTRTFSIILCQLNGKWLSFSHHLLLSHIWYSNFYTNLRKFHCVTILVFKLSTIEYSFANFGICLYWRLLLVRSLTKTWTMCISIYSTAWTFE